MLSKKIKAIVVLASFLTVSSFAFTVKADMTTTRLGGADRYETNIAISNEFVKDNKTDTAILASSIDYPDSLSAAPLTGIYNAPILITEKDKLTTSIENQIKKLGIKKVIIIGGTGVVSEKVNSRLKELGISTERLAGADRYETNMIIANRAAEKYVEQKGGLHTAIVAIPDYKDVLTMAPISVYEKAPIILVKENVKKISDVKGLQEFIDKYVPSDLSDHADFETLIVGGMQANFVKELPNYAPSGDINDKYLNNLTLNYMCQGDLNFSNVVIANGENFPDALGGGALAGKLKAPIVFVGNSKLENDWGIYEQIRSLYLQSYYVTKNVYYLGGSAVVPDGSESRIK